MATILLVSAVLFLLGLVTLLPEILTVLDTNEEPGSWVVHCQGVALLSAETRSVARTMRNALDATLWSTVSRAADASETPETFDVDAWYLPSDAAVQGPATVLECDGVITVVREVMPRGAPKAIHLPAVPSAEIRAHIVRQSLTFASVTHLCVVEEEPSLESDVTWAPAPVTRLRSIRSPIDLRSMVDVLA